MVSTIFNLKRFQKQSIIIIIDIILNISCLCLAFIILNNSEIKSNLMRYLNKKNIEAVFHYIPLHSTSFGKKQSKFFSEDKFTTNYSERLLRLPLFFSLKNSEVDIICKHIKDFFKKN